MSNLTSSPAAWLDDLFEFEYCAECGGDSQHHTAIPLNGNWFARCDYPMSNDSEIWHPKIQAFRKRKLVDSLASYVTAEDTELSRKEFLATVAERITEDIA